jgi:hypothetical protein
MKTPGKTTDDKATLTAIKILLCVLVLLASGVVMGGGTP